MTVKAFLLRKPFHYEIGYCKRFYTCNRIVEIYSRNDINVDAKIKGWVKSVRKMKNMIFVDVDDGSCSKQLQVVLQKNEVSSLIGYGCSVEAEGKLTLNSNNQLELIADKVKVLGSCDLANGYPFAPRKHYPLEYIRQYLHLRPRTPIFSALLRVRHSANKAIHDFFDSKGFFCVHSPILTTNDCEGAGEIFQIQPANNDMVREMTEIGLPQSKDEIFFGGKTYLTVSGQFHLESIARGLEKVYTFGPTFRAENSKSRLHLSEFYMIEAEKAFTSDLNDILTLTECLVKDTTCSIMDKCSEEVYNFRKLEAIVDPRENEVYLEQLINSPFGVLSYDEAFALLEKNSASFKIPLDEGQSLKKEHELFLVKYNNNVPVFVIDWPKEIKPFYMKSLITDESKVSAMDLLCPGVGELCGGSIREDSYDLLKEKLNTNGLESQLGWYLELRKFGNVPTGGFGMGFERYLQVLLGTHNIKDTIPFPRYPHNCKL